MSENHLDEGLHFDMPKNRSSVIKVMGVGGGGSNAVNHMKQLGIKGVDFIVCNTDAQALQHSPVEVKIQLGINLTEGLGAGANPEIGEKAALETTEEIKRVLEHNTKMLFITAGMGGGTGTGAAPIIARVAREMGILTVGIVTSPFAFEGKMRLKQAENGIEKFKANLDSLIVINNNKLREVYGNLGFKAGFAKADEVLATAAKGIAEVITHHYTTNIDLKDAKTVLSDSGTAIMGSASASGSDRALESIRQALDSPLLNDNHIVGAKNVLLLIISGSEENEITFDEIGEINDYIQNEAGNNANIIMGIGEDPELGNAVSVTVVATGFEPSANVQHFTKAPERVVHSLDDDSMAFDSPITASAPQVIEPDIPLHKTQRQRDLFEEVDGKSTSGQSIDLEEGNKPEVEDHFDAKEEKIVDSASETNPAEDKIVYELDDTDEAETEFHAETGDIDRADFGIEENPEILGTENKEPEYSVDFEFTIEDVFAEEDSAVEVSDGPEEAAEDGSELPFAFDEPLDEPREEPVESEAPVAGKEMEIRHTLDDLIELETRLGVRSPRNDGPEKVEIKNEDEELHFEVRQLTEEETTAEAESKDSYAPMNQPIDMGMKQRASERRKRLEAFNFRFKTTQNNLLETEKIPAYKRQGMEIDPMPQSTQSKIGGSSLGGDDLELRSNNRFLHDNVD